jgi:hypothetical protein
VHLVANHLQRRYGTDVFERSRTASVSRVSATGSISTSSALPSGRRGGKKGEGGRVTDER